MIKGLKKLPLTLTTLLGLSVASMAPADDGPVRWRMQSWFPSGAPHAGSSGKDIGTKLDRLSGGSFRVQFYEPGALIPPNQCLEAVGRGSVQACWSTPAYWYGDEPALALYSAAPFGMDWPGLMAWFYHGGGQQMYDTLYARHNVKAMPCGGMIPEASGWFRKEVNSVEDFQGMRMRFLGLGALVLEKMGVSTMLLPGGELYAALERGVIDATEFAAPSVDKALGLNEVASFYYFPGWHQPATLYDFMINKDEWEALSDQQQAMVEYVCGDNVRDAIALGESLQSGVLAEFEAKGVELRRWSPEILATLETAWEEVAQEESAKNADFAEVWTSMETFQEEYQTWSDIGYLDR